MNKILNILYALLFFALILVAPITMYLLNPIILYVNIFFLIFSSLYYVFHLKNKLTYWALRSILAVDQGWQTWLSPILNVGVTTDHKFGNADESASSVVGKNLKETDELRWKIIEFVLSTVMEGGKPHSIKAIENDEV